MDGLAASSRTELGYYKLESSIMAAFHAPPCVQQFFQLLSTCAGMQDGIGVSQALSISNQRDNEFLDACESVNLIDLQLKCVSLTLPFSQLNIDGLCSNYVDPRFQEIVLPHIEARLAFRRGAMVEAYEKHSEAYM